jgi:hypothetical protein
VRLERDAYGMADQCMLGEEDPGAAMDLIYGVPLPPPAAPGLSIPEAPLVADAEESPAIE